MTDNTSETEANSDGDASSHDQRTEQLPETIQSPRAKLVYLYLRTVKEAQVAELKQALGMQALALYPILELLVDQKLVKHVGDGYIMATEYTE